MAIIESVTVSFENGILFVLDEHGNGVKQPMDPDTGAPWADEATALAYGADVARQTNIANMRPLGGEYEWDNAAEEWVIVPEPAEEPSA